MFGRWIHVCQAIDFITSKITSVVNGEVVDVANCCRNYYNKAYNESNPLGRIKSMKDNFIIGLSGAEDKWYGKFIFICLSA